MTCQLNRQAWRTLIEEDLEWLKAHHDGSLEAQHIADTLRWLTLVAPSVIDAERHLFEIVEQMHQTPHYHVRRGFVLGDLPAAIASNHLIEEAAEAQSELLVPAPDRAKVLKELADTIGVFHRLCVKLGMTPQMVMDVAVTNLKETFTTDLAAVRCPLGGITRSTRAE
mgnify:CR=1 FL=1